MRFSAYTLALLFLQFQVSITISHSAVIFFYTKKLSFRLTLNPGLALTCFRKTRLYMPVEIFGPFSWYVGRFQFDAKFCLEIAENFQWRMEQRISAFRLKGQPCEVYPDSTASSLSFPLKSVGSKTFQNEVSKTNKRASVTVNVTCEQECREPLSEPLVTQTRSHITLAVTLARLLVLRYSSRVFEEKRDCSSLHRHFRNFLTGNFSSIWLPLWKFRNFLLKGSLFGNQHPGYFQHQNYFRKINFRIIWELSQSIYHSSIIFGIFVWTCGYSTILISEIDGRHAKSRDNSRLRYLAEQQW